MGLIYKSGDCKANEKTNQGNMEESRKQQHFVLVHGSCHGAWCWYRLATLLESAGYRVTIPDLAASGIDSRSTDDVATLAEYSQPLIELIANSLLLSDQEKVILVGHSSGGLSIALAADMFPEKVAAVVFLTAFMPDYDSKPSFILDQFFKQNPSTSPAWMDTRFNVDPTKPHRSPTMIFGPEFMASKLYQHCQPEDLKLATMLLRPGSVFLHDLANETVFSRDRYGSVTTFYIKCSKDLAVSEDFQRRMIENHPAVKEVIEIKEADHMAMLSTPKELCQSLIHIAEETPGF